MRSNRLSYSPPRGPSLRAANRSARTKAHYLTSLDLFIATSRPTLGRSTSRSFGALTSKPSSPTSAIVGRPPPFRPAKGLAPVLPVVEEEGEVERSPMAKMSPPMVPEQSVAVLSEDQLRALLKACDGKDFDDRRGAAMIRLLLDTGMRRGELVGLRVDDVDLAAGLAMVLGKGRRERACPFGDKTALALDRYLRARRGHRSAALSWLWLGPKGRLGESGVGQMGTEGAIPVALLRNRADESVESSGGGTSLAGEESTVGGAVGNRAVRPPLVGGVTSPLITTPAPPAARAEASVTSGLPGRYAMLGRYTFG
jgi:hypothetical protein